MLNRSRALKFQACASPRNIYLQYMTGYLADLIKRFQFR